MAHATDILTSMQNEIEQLRADIHRLRKRIDENEKESTLSKQEREEREANLEARREKCQTQLEAKREQGDFPLQCCRWFTE